MTRFAVGELVKKVGGDYQFEGQVVAAFAKKSGAIRYVVEDDRGVLHIYSDKNLMLQVLAVQTDDNGRII